jgi:phage shock protein A
MGLFDRLSRVVRANLNDMIENAENPEAVLEQAIINMQEDLIQLRQAVARAIATQQRTEQQYNKNQAETDNWQNRAALALSKGDESLAREALTRKKAVAEAAAKLESQLEQQTVQVEALKKNLIALESKISEAKTKKDMLKSRAAAAKANQQLKSTIGRLGTGSAMAAFERMEDKVLEIEARSQAEYGLVNNDLEPPPFKLVQPDYDFDDEDDELAAMKASLTGRSVPGKPKEVLIMEKAIRDTRNAITIATAKQSQIQNQQAQAETEIKTLHKKALQAALKGDQASAMQALMSEAAQEKLTDVLKSPLEQQETVVELLKKNLATLEEVKITVEKLVEAEEDEGDEPPRSPSSNSAVDAELEALREQIDNL